MALKHDPEKAALAFYLTSEVARLLREALDQDQAFQSDITYGNSPDRARLDGSCQIQISIGPTLKSEVTSG